VPGSPPHDRHHRGGREDHLLQLDPGELPAQALVCAVAERRCAAGYDLGMNVAHGLAASQRDRVTHLAVGESVIPGLSPSRP
jgi:hypothetical protein